MAPSPQNVPETSEASPQSPNASRKIERHTKDLASTELWNILAHNRKGRHSQSRSLTNRSSSAPSLVSEIISESSTGSNRWKEMLEQEPVGGVSSHELSRRTAKLGLGKKHFLNKEECPWTGNYLSSKGNIVLDHRGEDDNKVFTSLAGERKWKKTFGQRKDAIGDLFNNTVEEKEFRSRKHFPQQWDQVFTGTEDFPLGAGTQIDDSPRKIKRRVDASKMTAQMDRDVVTHNLDSEPDPNDLSGYGLAHRGKRKFLVQTSLATGLSPIGEDNFMLRRSPSAPGFSTDPPVKSPNTCPFWQDDLPDEERAAKGCHQNIFVSRTGVDRHLEGRGKHIVHVPDNTWACLKFGCDDATASRFIEGQDLKPTISTEEPAGIRNPIYDESAPKSTGGKVPGVRNPIYDESACQSGDYTIVRSPIYNTDVKESAIDEMKSGDGRYQKANETAVCWGAGYGKKKFVEKSTGDLIKMEVQSPDSNSSASPGVRRKNDMVRSHSARRFPQKDLETLTSRSATPRATSDTGTPPHERPRWKK